MRIKDELPPPFPVFHTSVEHVAYSALGAGIAIEMSGAGDLSWSFYACTIGLVLIWSVIVTYRRFKRHREGLTWPYSTKESRQ